MNRRIKRYLTDRRWWLKQKLATPGRFYGGDGTIHGTTQLNIEMENGEVVAVWYRCSALPFDVTEVHDNRAREMRKMYRQDTMPKIFGLELWDEE